MINLEKIIINSNIIADYLGYWPNFHDSEIIELRMERNSPGITIKFYLFSLTGEVNENKEYEIDKECSVDLFFDRVSELQLEGFNHQNSVYEMIFNEKEDGIEVIINASFGLQGSFLCKSVTASGLERVYDKRLNIMSV